MFESTLLEAPPVSTDIQFPVKDVPVIDSCDPSWLNENYLSGLGSPVIIRNGMADWPAMARWNFQFFADRYATKPHLTNTDLNAKSGWRRLRFDDYLLYCQCPELSPLGPSASGRPYYSAFPLIREFPELLPDVPPAGCIDNIYSRLEGQLADWYQNIFVWLFIGPAGTVTEFHIDHFMAHTYSAQIVGRKKFLFYSPACFANLSGAAARKAERDLNRRPDCVYDEPVVVHEAIIGPGEIVVFPAGWAHEVYSLEPSISLSVNFVNASNYLEHLLSISRNLPTWAKRIHWPSFREANQCNWNARDFDWLKG